MLVMTMLDAVATASTDCFWGNLHLSRAGARQLLSCLMLRDRVQMEVRAAAAAGRAGPSTSSAMGGAAASGTGKGGQQQQQVPQEALTQLVVRYRMIQVRVRRMVLLQCLVLCCGSGYVPYSHEEQPVLLA